MKARIALLATGLLVMSAASLSAQAGAVTCRDGTRSRAVPGACSSHGGFAAAGVTKSEVKAEKKAEKREEKIEKAQVKAEKHAEKVAVMEDRIAAGAIAQCKDRTYSHAKTRRGACSNHGGVSRYLDRR